MLNRKYKSSEIENIIIYRTETLRNQPHEFCVDYRLIHPKGSLNSFTCFSKKFAIRDALGNPTEIGRRIGINCKDKRISSFSPEARVIHDYLYKLAWKAARGLVFGGANVDDRTGYNKKLIENNLI